MTNQPTPPSPGLSDCRRAAIDSQLRLASEALRESRTAIGLTTCPEEGDALSCLADSIQSILAALDQMVKHG